MSNKGNVQEQQWKSQFGFLLAALGSAIGLGNIWRFAYLTYSNGGGTFVFVYIITLFVIGIPFLMLEFGVGHYYKTDPPNIFKNIKNSQWIGWLAVLVSFTLGWMYPIILSWCLLFLIYSFNLGWGANTEDFFYKDFLNLSNGPFDFGAIQGEILLANIVIWIFTWIILKKGVSGLEKANKIFMPILFILISILVFWSISLEGAIEGIKQYLSVDLDKIWDSGLWLDAFSQVFFSLSIGYGLMIVYASYLKDKSDINKASIITGVLDGFFALFAGVAIFSILGFMAFQNGVALDEVVKGGPGLAFIVYPQALNIMAEQLGETVARVFGILFFFSLILAGLSSLIAIVETYTNTISKKYNLSRNNAVLIAIGVTFLINILFTTSSGFYVLDIVDHFVISYGVLFVGFMEAILIGWFIKAEIIHRHINSVSVMQVGNWWNIVIKLILPVALVLNISVALYNEFQSRYGNYSLASLMFFGVFSFVLLVIVSLFISRKSNS